MTAPLQRHYSATAIRVFQLFHTNLSWPGANPSAGCSYGVCSYAGCRYQPKLHRREPAIKEPMPTCAGACLIEVLRRKAGGGEAAEEAGAQARLRRKQRLVAGEHQVADLSCGGVGSKDGGVPKDVTTYQ